MGRAPCCDKSTVKRGPWSAEEDARLRSYIEQHGTGGNWIALPRKIGLKRCGKSCRLRWLNYLRPDIRHGGFSEEEDRIICSLYIAIGSRWSIIAAQLPGRTDNDIKNYWNTRLKKKLFGNNNNNKSHAHDFIKQQQQQHDQHATIHATLMPPLPANNVQTYSSGTTGMDIGVGAGVCVGGGLDMSTESTSAVGFAAGSSATMVEPTSYARATAMTELDEIFRFIGTSGGGESVYSLPETSMDWHGLQLQDVQQQQY